MMFGFKTTPYVAISQVGVKGKVNGMGYGQANQTQKEEII